MGRRPNRPEGRFQRAEAPAAAAERCRACRGRPVGRPAKPGAGGLRLLTPSEDGVPCGPYFAVGRGGKERDAGWGNIIACGGAGVWYH